MSDPFGNLFASLRALEGVTVTYRRGEESFEVTAVIGSTKVEIADQNGRRVRVEVRDYLLASADLLIDEQPIEPQNGDVIEQTIGTNVNSYEVTPLGADDCWRFSDPGQLEYRIHTKRISVVTIDPEEE